MGNPKDSFDKLNKAIEAFAENISKEVAEKRMYQVDEVKAIAKTRLWFAIKECLKLTIAKEESEYREMCRVYGNMPNWKKVKYGGEISKIKAKKKDANRLLHTIQDYDEYEQLKHFLKKILVEKPLMIL